MVVPRRSLLLNKTTFREPSCGVTTNTYTHATHDLGGLSPQKHQILDAQDRFRDHYDQFPGYFAFSLYAPMERPPGRQPRINSTRPAPRGTASYHRRRAVTACQVCRARRTKCDNLKPTCSFCLKVGATCIQAPPDFSSFDPASIQILERLDVLERLMRGENPPAASTPPEDDMDLEHPAPLPQASGTPAAASRCMIHPWPLKVIMAWACFQDLFASEELTEDYCFPSSPATSMDVQSPGTTLAATDLEPQCVRELVNNFFRYVHVKNPILDEHATRAVVDSAALNGIDWSPHSCLSLLICALGAIATPFGPSDSTAVGTIANARGYSYFRAAERRIGMLITSFDIIAPQCLFLAGVFMMCNFEPVRAWRFFIQALAQCQHLKLHSPRVQRELRESAHDPHFQNGLDPLDQAMYWSAWKSEREMRALLSLADFRLGETKALYPAFFPTPPPPRDQETGLSGPGGQKRGRDHETEQTAWYFYLAEISLRRVTARLHAELEELRETHGASREAFLQAAASVVPSYEAQIQAWAASLPPGLSLSAPVEEDDICRFVLRGHCAGLQDRIYWPFLAAFLDGEQDALSSAWLAPFAGFAQKGLDQQKLQIAVNKPGYRHRHHGTYGLIQACSKGALVLTAASLQSRVSSLGPVRFLTMPPHWENDVHDVINLLGYWGEETRIFDGIRTVIQSALSTVS